MAQFLTLSHNIPLLAVSLSSHKHTPRLSLSFAYLGKQVEFKLTDKKCEFIFLNFSCYRRRREDEEEEEKTFQLETVILT